MHMRQLLSLNLLFLQLFLCIIVFIPQTFSAVTNVLENINEFKDQEVCSDDPTPDITASDVQPNSLYPERHKNLTAVTALDGKEYNDCSEDEQQQQQQQNESTLEGATKHKIANPSTRIKESDEHDDDDDDCDFNDNQANDSNNNIKSKASTGYAYGKTNRTIVSLYNDEYFGQGCEKKYGYPCLYARECGMSFFNEIQSEFTLDIIHGEATKTGQWPFYVQILTSVTFCSGVLVTRWHVLTARHCLDNKRVNPSNTRLTFGITQLVLDPREQAPETLQWRDGAKFLYYPKPFMDMAWIVLKDPVEFTKYVQPACYPWDHRPLPATMLVDKAECYIVGGGLSEGGIRDNIKKVHYLKVALDGQPVEGVGACPHTLDPRGICWQPVPGWSENKTGLTALGDSGAAVVCLNSVRRWEIVSIHTEGIPYGGRMFARVVDDEMARVTLDYTPGRDDNKPLPYIPRADEILDNSDMDFVGRSDSVKPLTSDDLYGPGCVKKWGWPCRMAQMCGKAPLNPRSSRPIRDELRSSVTLRITTLKPQSKSYDYFINKSQPLLNGIEGTTPTRTIDQPVDTNTTHKHSIINNRKTAYIQDGTATKEGEWPQQIVLMDDNGPVCMGAIVTPFHVITAEHCVLKRHQLYLVVAGIIYVPANKDSLEYLRDSSNMQVRKLVGIYRSPEWNRDLAWLILQKPLKFNDYVQPACFPYSHSPRILVTTSYSRCFIVAGGGYTTTIALVPTRATTGKVSWARIRRVKLESDSSRSCIGKSFHLMGDMCFESWRPPGLVDNQPSTNTLARGDSGAPVMCLDEQNRWTLIGVSGKHSSNTHFHAATINYDDIAVVTKRFDWPPPGTEMTSPDIEILKPPPTLHPLVPAPPPPPPPPLNNDGPSLSPVDQTPRPSNLDVSRIECEKTPGSTICAAQDFCGVKHTKWDQPYLVIIEKHEHDAIRGRSPHCTGALISDQLILTDLKCSQATYNNDELDIAPLDSFYLNLGVRNHFNDDKKDPNDTSVVPRVQARVDEIFVWKERADKPLIILRMNMKLKIGEHGKQNTCWPYQERKLDMTRCVIPYMRQPNHSFKIYVESTNDKCNISRKPKGTICMKVKDHDRTLEMNRLGNSAEKAKMRPGSPVICWDQMEKRTLYGVVIAESRGKIAYVMPVNAIDVKSGFWKREISRYGGRKIPDYL